MRIWIKSIKKSIREDDHHWIALAQIAQVQKAIYTVKQRKLSCAWAVIRRCSYGKIDILDTGENSNKTHFSTKNVLAIISWEI